MFGPAFGLDLSTGFIIDDYGNVSYSYSDSVNYRKYLEFVNDLYEEGLIEKDYEKCTRDIIKERCSRNITGVTFDKQLAKYVRKPLPFMYVSSSDVDKNNGYINYISKYVDDEENDFITGRQSLSSFDAYLNTLDNMGIKEITSIKQKQYNLYKNNM